MVHEAGPGACPRLALRGIWAVAPRGGKKGPGTSVGLAPAAARGRGVATSAAMAQAGRSPGPEAAWGPAARPAPATALGRGGARTAAAATLRPWFMAVGR